jgi:diaminopimelate epimerase
MTSHRSLALVKAHAYGNDFLLLPVPTGVPPLGLPALARRACERHRAIGADGLIAVQETPAGATTQLFNADGSRSEVSGNGVRCVGAWLARRRGLGAGAELVVGTAAGAKSLRVIEVAGTRYTIRAAMGPPAELRQERIDVAGHLVEAIVMRIGNPQCVVLGEVTQERLRALGAALAVHPFFPEGTNVELATVERPDRVRILIWERGVGPTEASGTGACAAAVAAAAYGGANRSVDVVAPGGTQHVEWSASELWLTGWAEVVGEFEWWVGDDPELVVPPHGSF